MTIEPDARGKVYRRDTNGVVDFITVKEALAVVNDLMMNGRTEVESMSSSRGHHTVRFQGGGVVEMVEIDAADMPAPDARDNWTVASHRTLLHNFTEPTGDGRALCNKGYRPWRYGNGYSFQTRAQLEASEYADLYRFCPKCTKKSG